MSLAKLEAAAELSGNLQSTFNFVTSLIFSIVYFISFFGPPSSDKDAPQQKNAPHRGKAGGKRKVNPIIVKVAILYAMTYTIRYLLFVILWAIEDVPLPYIWEEEILEYFFDLCFSIAAFAFNLLMILRLHTGFRGTIYQTKKVDLIILYTLLSVSFIINEFYFIIRHNRKKPGHIFYHDKVKSEFGAHTYLFLIVVILNFVLGGILIYKFNKNVWKLVELRQDANSKLHLDEPRDRRGTIETLGKTMDVMSKKFLGISIKYTLLCSICIVFTNLQFSGWILLQFNRIEDYETILYFDIFWSWLFDVVLITNFVCIWLSFPFSKPYYYKRYICGYWNEKCESCCMYVVGRRIYADEKKKGKKMAEYLEHQTENKDDDADEQDLESPAAPQNHEQNEVETVELTTQMTQ